MVSLLMVAAADSLHQFWGSFTPHNPNYCSLHLLMSSEVFLASVCHTSRSSLYFAEDMKQHDDAHI
jgi:hypothetical protein